LLAWLQAEITESTTRAPLISLSSNRTTPALPQALNDFIT